MIVRDDGIVVACFIFHFVITQNRRHVLVFVGGGGTAEVGRMLFRSGSRVA